MDVEWYKCAGNVWCELNKLDLSHRYVKNIKGVYIIWYEMQEIVVVRTGFGYIGDELEESRSGLEVQAFAKYKLKVSWTDIPKNSWQGVFNYLTEKLKPKLASDEVDNTTPVEINLPWES